MFNASQSIRNPTYFVGVVEDRNDPLNLGRVRVRCFGIHTEDKAAIPTNDLPWAMPIMPFHSASISGVGVSPTGPVEGTWVFGMFIDGQELQQPIIMGTMVGTSSEKKADTLGFKDPLGVYPKEKYINQSSVNKLARGDNAYGEESLAIKIRDRVRDVKKSTPPQVPTVRDLEEKEFYARPSWNEPNPRYGGQRDLTNDKVQDTCELYDLDGNAIGPNKSTYPYNHTYTTESGHVMEYDDTPNGERIHQYHTAGTFYEIQPDGTRVTKVVGEDYEIVIRNKNVVIQGSCSVTIQGDSRVYVQGNKYEEVEGDYHLNIKGSAITKIQGNEQKEIMSDQAIQVNGDRRERITKNKKLVVDGSEDKTVRGTSNTTIHDDVYELNRKYKRLLVGESYTYSTTGNTNITVGSHYNLLAVANVKIESSVTVDIDGGANVDIDGPRIDLN